MERRLTFKDLDPMHETTTEFGIDPVTTPEYEFADEVGMVAFIVVTLFSVLVMVMLVCISRAPFARL